MTLLVANLLFLAWAKWIDSPRDAGAQDALSHLPRLQLVGENPGSKPAAANVPPPAAVAEQVVLQVPQGLPGRRGLPVPEATQTCKSVGPFNDIAHAARAAGLIAQRGFHLQQRAEEGETIEGYWVFVGGMKSDEDVGEVVARLEKNGVSDAHVMRNFSTNRRISVGMFSTRERADRRAAAIKAMGLSPEVGERKFPGTVYWVDVALASGTHLPPDYSFADIGSGNIVTQPCPPPVRPVAPPGPQSLESRTTVASAPK
jgi:hypothetical protein